MRQNSISNDLGVTRLYNEAFVDPTVPPPLGAAGAVGFVRRRASTVDADADRTRILGRIAIAFEMEQGIPIRI